MTWAEIAAIVVLLIGIGAGGFLVAQRPAFWWGLGAVAFKAAWPFLLKRKSPEEEAADRQKRRQGDELNRPKHR